MTEQDKMKLEETHKLVESIHFRDVLYAVDRQGKGIHILYGKANSKELALSADDVLDFLQELWEIWNLHK
jgi:hypothetical protein